MPVYTTGTKRGGRLDDYQALQFTLKSQMSLVRRYYLLEEFHTDYYQAPNFSELAELAKVVVCETHFSWCDWARYSNRQQ